MLTQSKKYCCRHLPVNYFPLPFGAALSLPLPETFPVLLGQPPGPFSRLPLLPPPRLPVDFAIVITSSFVDIHRLMGNTITSQLRQSCFSCYMIAKLLPFYSTSQLPPPFPIAAIIFLPRSVQLFSASAHCPWFINFYSERHYMSPSKPPICLE